MTFLSAFARRFKGIAAVADVRVKPQNAKPDLAKAPLEKPAQISNKLPANIKAANEVINTLPPVTHPPSRVSQAGIDLMHRFEGCAMLRADGRYQAYPDPGSADGHPWTIGWGSTGKDNFNGGEIRRGTIWTKAQCDERFEKDLAQYAFDVVRALGPALANTSQAQFDALVSFHYNTGAIDRATLTRKHVAGDHAGAAKEFGRWVRNDGKVMKGLVRRRAAEAELYRSGM